MIHKLTKLTTRTFAFVLALCTTGSAWATYANGTTLSWKSRDSITTAAKVDGGGYTFKIKIPYSDELPKYSRVKITQIKIGAREDRYVSQCGAYISINGVNSDSISAFDGTMYVDSNQTRSLNVCNYVFSSDLILFAGVEYFVQPYNGSGVTMNSQTAAIQPLPSPQVISFSADGSYCCAYEVYGEVVSTELPIYKASSSGSIVSLNALSWTFNDEAASLPADLATCGMEVTLEDGATLTIDKDISSLPVFVLKGVNARIESSSDSYMSTATDWTFSGFTGELTVDASHIASDIIKPWLVSGPSKITVQGNVTASWSTSENPLFTTHTTFDSGTSSLTILSDSYSGDVCNNSSNSDPWLHVKDNAVLNLKAKDLGGYAAAQKSQYCVIAVDDGGELNLSNNSSSTFYYQGRFLLYPGAMLNIGTMSSNDKLRLNAGVSAEYEQIYVPSQVTDASSNPVVVASTGGANSVVNAFGNGFGVYVGENAKLDWSASLSANGSAKVMKSGAGTLCIKNMPFQNYVTGSEGTIELYADSNLDHSFMSSPFTGVIKVTTQNGAYQQFGHTGTLSSSVFSGRPTLVANGDIRFYKSPADKPFTVKNMSGSGYFRNENTYDDADVWKYVDTLQTTDTTYDGVFKVSSNDNFVNGSPALTVRGDSELHSLTLTGASDTTGPLTIENNAKVVFSSTGKWSGGTVTVKNGGVLESQNTGSIAANLSVEEGATLKFASGVQLSATDYDWSAISNDESINVDLSAITPSATPVILIADGVDVSSDKFRVAASQCPVTLSVDNGALKASFFNFWRDGTWGVEVVPGDDATLYISQNSELTVSEALSLGTVTVVKEGEGNVALTISGDGALTTSGWTIPEGVTVNTPPTMTISGNVSGAGVLNVPANNTLAMDDSDCSVKITANAGSTLNFTDCAINGGLSAQKDGSVTINTYGTVSFGSSANNDFQYSTTLNVERGTTTYNSKDDTKLWCTINVKSGATLVNAREDGFNWGADTRWPIHAHIWGTLTMNEKWTIGAGNYIHLYDGALIDGTASDALHFNTGCGNIVAEKGDSIITAPFVKGWGTIAVEVKSGATLSTVETPEIATRTGEGKLLKRIVDATRWGVSSAPANYDGIELYSSGSHESNDNETFLNSSFAGYLKITTKDGDYRSFGWVAAGSFNNPVFSSRPTLELAGEARIYHSTSDKPFTIKDLSGTGYIRNFNTYDSNVYKYIDTLQTKNTEFSGVFATTANNDYKKGDPSLTVRGADDATDIYSLTLSGVSDTTAPLTIENKAKVVFSSTGKWSGGTVTVKDGGVLESQNSDDVAATLVVEKGATLKFATGDQSIQATAYDWSDVDEELEENERIKVDISEATPSNTPISIIPSGVTVDVSKFVISPALNPYTTPYSAALSVDNGALKVTYSGNFCQDGSWLVGPTANGDAKVWLTQNSTLTTTTDLSLGSVAFSNMAGADVTLTVDGTGELKFGGLNLPSKITIDVAGKLTITGSVSGAGTINVLDGGELTMDDATCSTKITVQDGGKLYTKGTTTLSSSANVFYYGSAFEVVDGTTTLTTASAGLKGNITIDGNATLTVGATGGINSGATALEPTELHVYGSLNMSSYQWVFGANNALYFYTGCSFAGEGPDAFGPLEINYSPIYVRPNGETTGTVTLPLKTVFRHDTSVDVAANMTFTIAGYLQIGYAGDWVGFAKTGTGDFTLTPSGYNTGINFATTTVSAGRMIMTSMPMFPSVVIEDGATFTLKDTEWTSGNVFSGTGILELYSATVSKTHTITGSTFGGTLKLSNVPVPGSNPPTWQNNINPSGSAMFDSSVRPEFVCDSTATHLGSGYYKSDSTKIEVRNLSGAGSLRAQWTSSSDCHYTIETKQTKATAFTGTIAAEDGDSKTGGGKYTRYINLSVIGDDSETPNSLTITQRQNTSSSDSSQALSTLTVSDNAKVIFGENGGWGYGHVIVGDDGYLECTNNAAVKKLTLNDGATLVFPTSSSCLSEITSITFSSGTVTVSYPSGVTPTSGTKLINWSSAPAGSFVFDNGSTVKQFGGAYYMLETDATGLYIRKAVAVDSLVSSTFYTSVAGALEENNTVYLIAAPDESVTLPVGKTISNQMGVSTSNLTVSPTTAEYAVQYVVNGSYTVASTAVTYYWAGAAGGDWGTRSNWKVAAADGPDATRDMETTDSVAFTDGAIVALGATRRVAGIAIDGTVYVSAVDAATKSLETTGNITGTGALTLVDVTLANVATATLTVAPAVNFTSDSELAATGGYGFTFNGAVSIGAVSISDTIKVWNVNHSVAGTTTLNGNFTKAGGYGLILGAVTVAANTTPTISNGSITINGAVTVSAGATFTIPASGLTVGDSASFVLGGKSSVLVDNGSGASGKVSTSMTDGAKVISTTSAGVTTYKVVYGTIFSVY